MTESSDNGQWKGQLKLSAKIDSVNKFLEEYKNRETLSDLLRTELVEAQIEKARLIAILKMSVMRSTNIPSSVLKIYF